MSGMYLEDGGSSTSVFLENNIKSTIMCSAYPGEGVTPSMWNPMFQGKDDAKSQREILRFSRNKNLSDGNTYYWYATLQWKDEMIRKNFGVQLCFRVDCQWLMDDKEKYSDMFYDVGSDVNPHVPNQWDPKSEGSGAIVLYISKTGDENQLKATYRVTLRRYTTFGFDNFQVTVDRCPNDCEEPKKIKEIQSSERNGSGMREYRSYHQLKEFKVGKMVRFNAENLHEHRHIKPERALFAKF